MQVLLHYAATANGDKNMPCHSCLSPKLCELVRLVPQRLIKISHTHVLWQDMAIAYSCKTILCLSGPKHRVSTQNIIPVKIHIYLNQCT